MILKTGKEPHVEHIHVPVGTNKIAFGSVNGDFASVPISDLQRGGEVWIVRLAPSSEMTPTFIFWTEPKVERKGLHLEVLRGTPDIMRELSWRLEREGAPDDVNHTTESLYGGEVTRHKYTWFEVTS